MNKPAVIISACLYGEPVRYDGQAKPLPTPVLQNLAQHYTLIPVCPECMGGLKTPRAPAEIIGASAAEVLTGHSTVKTAKGEDLSAAFIIGANAVLQQAQSQDCKLAIFKANSPSCGVHQHYDGSFSGTLCTGPGVATALLQSHGIRVIDEDETRI